MVKTLENRIERLEENRQGKTATQFFCWQFPEGTTGVKCAGFNLVCTRLENESIEDLLDRAIAQFEQALPEGAGYIWLDPIRPAEKKPT